MSVYQVGEFAAVHIFRPRKVDFTVCRPESTQLLSCMIPRARVGIGLRQFSLCKYFPCLEYCSLSSVPVMPPESSMVLLECMLSFDELQNKHTMHGGSGHYWKVRPIFSCVAQKESLFRCNLF